MTSRELKFKVLYDVSKLSTKSFNYFTLFSGVPGVKPERLEEGKNIRHCALSLVGTML